MLRARLRTALLATLLVCTGLAMWAPEPVGASSRPSAVPRSSATSIIISGPGNNLNALLGLITSTRHRLLVEAYSLTDPAIIAAIQDAVRRGVDVRVMLDPLGLNSARTLYELARSGVRVRAPNPAFGMTHLAVVVSDASRAAILTAPLTTETLAVHGTGYLALDGVRADVVQVASLFYDDWLRRPVTLFGPHLIVLPDSSATLAALIDQAHLRIELYTSYLADPTILLALRHARERGVTLRVLTPPHGRNVGLRLAEQGGQVRFRDEGPGTVLVIDRHLAVLGSMDLSTYTLAAHREAAVVVDDPSSARRLDTIFFANFAHGVKLTIVTRKTHPAKKKHLAPGTAPALSAIISSRVRVNGVGVAVVTTAPGAHVVITITYPTGSRPAHGSTGGSGTARQDGSFVYRWLISGALKTGTIIVRITATAHGVSTSLSRDVVLTT